MDLSELRIRQGRKLVESLDRSGVVTVEAALWFYLSGTDRWRLVLKIKEADEIGEPETYRRIQRVIADQAADNGDSPEIRLLDVTVVGNDAPEVAALATLRPHLSTSGGTHGLRLRNNVIQGQVIDDVYIYRI